MGNYSKYYDKPCGRCGKIFQCKSHTGQKWCVDCGSIARKERRDEYNRKRREGAAK